MNKKILIISVCVIVCLVGLTYAYTMQKNTKTANSNISTSENIAQENIQENKEPPNIRDPGKYNDVTLTLDWKDISYKRGTSVPIHYTVTNNGKNAVYHVVLNHPLLKGCYKYFGGLKPGESKKFTYMRYIPTDSDMEEDMPGSGGLPNPWDIGDFDVTFKDDKGGVHKVTSTSIKIKWHD